MDILIGKKLNEILNIVAYYTNNGKYRFRLYPEGKEWYLPVWEAEFDWGVAGLIEAGFSNAKVGLIKFTEAEKKKLPNSSPFKDPGVRGFVYVDTWTPVDVQQERLRMDY